MPMQFFLLTIIILLSTLSTPALAHIGHLAELAGHGHWIGAVAVLGAVGLAAVLAKGKTADAEEQPEEEEVTDEETGQAV